MEMIYIAGRSVPCGDYDDALGALQYAYPEEWDALHYIRRNVGDIIDEAEGQLNNLKSDYKELELENSGNFEHGRDLVLEASEIAQDALELLGARRLDKQKLRSALEAIATMFHRNY